MKRLIIIGLAVFAGLIFASQTWAANAYAGDKGACNDAEDVKNYLAYNMPENAKDCLDILISQDPTNNELHFLKGKYCLEKGDYECANSRLTIEPVLAEYKPEIISLYKNAANAKWNNGQVNIAKMLYTKVIEFDQTYKNNLCIVLYEYSNKTGDETCFSYYRAIKDFCGSQYDKPIGNRFLTIAKERPKEKRKSWIKKASYFISQEEIESVFPPPTWQLASTHTFKGKGMGKNDDFGSVIIGKDLLFGDKSVITGKKFAIWHNGEWKTVEHRFETVNKSKANGRHVGLKIPRGEKVKYEIQRLTESF